MNPKHYFVWSTKTLAVVFFIGVFQSFAREAEEIKLDSKDLPQAVMDAFKKTYPNAVIQCVSKETEDGQTFFEIESKDGDVQRDLLYSADGQTVLVEETVNPDSIPAVVKEAVAKELPKGRIKKSEKVIEGGQIRYEFQVKSRKHEYELVLDPGGKIIEKAKAGKDEKDEKKNKGKGEKEDKDKD